MIVRKFNMLTYIMQIFTLNKMVELSTLTDEGKGINEEKHEGKIMLDSILGWPLLYFWDGPYSISDSPLL